METPDDDREALLEIIIDLLQASATQNDEACQ